MLSQMALQRIFSDEGHAAVAALEVEVAQRLAGDLLPLRLLLGHFGGFFCSQLLNAEVLRWTRTGDRNGRLGFLLRQSPLSVRRNKM